MLTRLNTSMSLTMTNSIMPFVENGIVDNVPHILLIALCKEKHSFCISFWCAQESFAIGVFARHSRIVRTAPRELFRCEQRLARAFHSGRSRVPLPAKKIRSVCDRFEEDLLGTLNPSKSITELGDLVPSIPASCL